MSARKIQVALARVDDGCVNLYGQVFVYDSRDLVRATYGLGGAAAGVAGFSIGVITSSFGIIPLYNYGLGRSANPRPMAALGMGLAVAAAGGCARALGGSSKQAIAAALFQFGLAWTPANL